MRRRRIGPGVADALLALLFGGIAVVDRMTGDQYQGGPLVVDALITTVVVGLLALRRLAPMRVLVLSCAVLVIPTFLVHHDFLIWSHLLPLLIDLFTVARHRTRRWALAGGVLVAATIWFELFVDVPDSDPSAVLAGLLVLAPVLGGRVLRRDAAQRAEIAAALARLEAERAARRRLAVLQERTRVARDLHDVVAHAVSLMLVQTRIAIATLDSDPIGAERGVLALESAGRAATTELRRMLGLLRAGDDDGPVGPAPGLDTVDDLVARLRNAGLRIHVRTEGTRPALPAGFEVSAYRIVQEALTNVLQHAGPVEATLLLRFGDEVAIDVLDSGGAAVSPPARGGHGLVGMRERVTLLGGAMEAGPDGDGFAVRVRLPLPEPAS